MTKIQIRTGRNCNCGFSFYHIVFLVVQDSIYFNHRADCSVSNYEFLVSDSAELCARKEET